MKRGRDAGSPGESRATAPRHSAGSARRSASHRTRRARARGLAQARPVEHRGPGSGNPDASRCWWRQCPTRPLSGTAARVRVRGVAGASGVRARHGPCVRRGLPGSAVRPRAASPGVLRESTPGRNSAGRDRSDCTAAPVHGSARTRTSGRDGRPVARLLGVTPEDLAAQSGAPLLRAGPARSQYTGAASASACCRARRAE